MFASGATGFTDIYNRTNDTWMHGPNFPTVTDTVGNCNNKTEQLVSADAPAALLPDGDVLIAASPIDASCGFGPWIPPTDFFEFDGTSLTQVASPANMQNDVSFEMRLLLLPTGQVLFTDSNFDGVEIYTPAGTPNSSWAPTIATFPAQISRGGANYPLTGTQFNGLSQAVGYGDDYQAATNYPLLRITNNSSEHVVYARTRGHSTMAVATGNTSSAFISTMHMWQPETLHLRSRGTQLLRRMGAIISSATVMLTAFQTAAGPKT